VDGAGEIDTRRLGGQARRLLRQGCHGLGLFGTTGEATSFSVAQRHAALEAVLGVGLPAERIILGIGTSARAETVALARHALSLGVRRLLMQPPFFYKRVADDGLFAAFAEVVEDWPTTGWSCCSTTSRRSPRSRDPARRRAARRRLPDAIRGIKDSSGDLAHTLGLIGAFPDLAVYPGTDTHLLDTLRAGGAGSISAAANLNAAASRRVFDAHRTGDGSAAEAGMAAVTAVRKVLERHPLIPSIKHVVADALGDPEWARVRPPLVPLDAQGGEAVRRELAAAGWAFGPP
jgi:4-hydroxy-tetrahydrodipicolinate synthase